MTRLCPICSCPLPSRTRSRFCPRCSLRGALELAGEEAILLENGRVIGDYEMLELLGRGGMGVVYRARQKRLNRFVAVKVLVAGEFADVAARRRFQAEAAAAARLRHPHIVAIHEIGEHEGQPFFSMELIEGRTFADLVRDGPLPPVTAARLLQPVAEAVHFAHQQGVLHRDLKPSNLMLDAFGLPRVSDFGLARQLDVSERFTLTGEVLGSPSYLAPEQARGDRASEGVVSDVYSLGAILYDLLTGRPPFLGASPQAILRQVIETEPLAPRRLNPAIPLDLETICLKCLEKEPARRYPTAQELAEELTRFQRREPLRARPIGRLGRGWRWSLRHPAKAGLMLALATTLLTLAVVPTLAYIRISRAEQARAVQLRETLLTQARALRLGGHSGQRREGWSALVAAAQPLHGTPEADFIFRLRREAIANLALEDAWFEPATNLPAIPDATLLRLDRSQQWIATGTYRGPVRVLRVADQTLVSEWALTNQTLQHIVDFSPDGRYLALRHRERIAIWEVTNQVMVTSAVASLNQFAFRGGAQAVAFLQTNTVVCFALPSGAKLWERSLEQHPGRRTLVFSPDGHWLALGLGEERGIELLGLTTPARVRLRMTPAVAALGWSADGRWLAAGGDNGSVRLWDLGEKVENGPGNLGSTESQPPDWTVETHGMYLQALAFSPDNHWLAAASYDETIRLFDVRTGRMGLAFAAQAFRLDFAPDGSRVGPVWQGGKAGWLHLTNAPAFQSVRFLSRGASPALALNEAGSLCAVASEREVLVFKANLAAPPQRLPLENTRAVYFQPEGALLGLTFSNVLAWPMTMTDTDVVFGEWNNPAPGGGGEVAAFSRDRRTLAFARYRSDTVEVWRNGELRHRLDHPRVNCVALHPNGNELISTSLDGGETRRWNVETGQPLAAWPDDGGNRTAFSADGKWLVQFGPRCVVRNTQTWQVRELLAEVPPNANTADAAFSPDGRWLAVIMADREVHLLSVRDFTPLAVFEAPSRARLNRLAWDQKGETLAVLAAQNELQIWNLRALRSGLAQLHADWPE